MVAPNVRKRTSVPGERGPAAGTSRTRSVSSDREVQLSRAHRSPPPAHRTVGAPHVAQCHSAGRQGWGRGQPGPSMAQTRRVGSRAAAKLERGYGNSRAPPQGLGPRTLTTWSSEGKKRAPGRGEKAKKGTVCCKIQPVDPGPGGQGAASPNTECKHFPPCPRP